jgi:hypothetical protein
MTSDDENVFEYGDRTIFELRTQSFAIEQEYGTMIGPPPDLPVVEAPVPLPIADDPISRLEQKLDLVMRRLDALQHKIDSIDSTLARALNR